MEMQPTPETLPNPNALHYAFLSSEYGLTLAERSRWEVFKPDWVSGIMWHNLLGDDVNNLRHMPHTHYLAKQFCEAQRLDSETTDVLLTVAMTHDWGEAIVGDIPMPEKTDDDERREEIAYRHIATTLLGDEQGTALCATVLPVLYPHHKETDGAPDMFRAIEYVGYCTTALRARHVADSIAHGFINLNCSRAQKEQLVGNLYSLHRAVEINNFSTLRDYVKKYPGLEGVLWHLR